MDNGASSYRRFLDGDENAFDDIMKALFHPLVFFLNRYVHDPEVAEDLAMDAFTALIVHKHRYHFQVSLKTYLFMIGRSRALDYLKRKKIVEFVALSREDFADERSLEEMVLTDQRKKAIHAAINKLPEEMQTAVHLVYLEGLSYESAAKVMKKSRKQVDNLLYRAKKELRIILEKDGDFVL